jgi:exopolysaccharide production protein ExoZ
MRTVNSIQCLRGLAAASVVVFHEFDALKGYSLVNIDEITGRLHVLGTIGVDIFFCISGFIMVVLLGRSEKGSRRQFLLRRAIRIVPTYWILTLVTYAARTAEHLQTPYPPPFTWDYLAASLFFFPMQNAAGVVVPVLSPGWTLSYEVFFYFTIAACIGKATGWVTTLIALLFLALVAIGGVTSPSIPVLELITDPLLLEFVMGMVIGTAFLRDAVSRPRFGVLCIALCCAVLVPTSAAFIRSDAERLLLRGVPAALLVLGCVCLESRAQLFSRRPLLAVGEASYSLYLTHVITLSLVNRVAAGRLGLPILSVACIGLAVALVAGYLFFVGVERPMIRWFSARLATRNAAKLSIA